jgi:predicted nucleic acid-binding protein
LTVVDTNVLIDWLADDPDWADWSTARVQDAASRGPLIINDIIYAELAGRFESAMELDRFVGAADLRHDALPTAALFLAGKAFLRYRRQGGTRTGVLPDFFIGAHATVLDVPLLTRDVRRYRTYFPGLKLIVPEGL